MFGIVSDELFEAQLSELKNPKAKVVNIQRGRGSAKEVPIELKKLIGSEGIAGGSNGELSKAFGVSESSVSAYKHDASSTSSYNEPNGELKRANDEVRTEIIGKSREKLLAAIDSITTEKLNDSKARDAASVAKDMSAVIKNMEPQNPNGGNTLNQQFVFHVPAPKQESDFETVEEK